MSTVSNTILITGLLIYLNAATAETNQTQFTETQRRQLIQKHKKLADLNAKMASCLESNKEFVECQQQMADACSNELGSNCPLRSVRSRAREKGSVGPGACCDWMLSPVNN